MSLFKFFSFYVLIFFISIQLNAQVNILEISNLIKNTKGEIRNLKNKSREIFSQIVTKDTLGDPISNFKKSDNQIDFKIYGSELFSGPETNILPKKNIPNNYLLGRGDELSILLDGIYFGKLLINNYGYIILGKYGPININGMTLNQANKKIRKHLASTKFNEYKSSKIKLILILEKIKNINVALIGAVYSGNYQISCLSTLFNLLYLGGGPDSIGSYRNIKVIRNGKLFRRIDLYAFLKDGFSNENVKLKDGDEVVITPYSKRIKILYENNKSVFLEIKKSENEINEILKLLEDIFPKKVYEEVQLTRIVNQIKMTQVIKISKNTRFEMQNGDELNLISIKNG